MMINFISPMSLKDKIPAAGSIRSQPCSLSTELKCKKYQTGAGNGEVMKISMWCI